MADETSRERTVERGLAEHGRLDIRADNARLGDLATIEETALSTTAKTTVANCADFVRGIA